MKNFSLTIRQIFNKEANRMKTEDFFTLRSRQLKKSQTEAQENRMIDKKIKNIYFPSHCRLNLI